MGLGAAFGDSAYVCKTCGHQTGLYSPNCPKCLGKTLARVEKVQHPGPSATNNKAPQYEDNSSPGRFPIEMVAIVIGLLVLGYSVYVNMQKKPEPAPVQATEPAPRAESRPRPVVRRPVKHAPVAAVKTHSSSASVAAAHRAPMKIFSDSE
jgi:hypothetical protein